MWLDDLALDADTVVLPDSTLRDVAVTAQGVRTGPDGLVATAMVVDATVPFDVVAEQIGGDSVVRAGEGSEAVVERTVEVAGRSFRVVATGSVEIVDGLLVVEPRTIDLGGPAFLSGLLGSVARGLVTIEHEVEGLPTGWCSGRSRSRTTASARTSAATTSASSSRPGPDGLRPQGASSVKARPELVTAP